MRDKQGGNGECIDNSAQASNQASKKGGPLNMMQMANNKNTCSEELPDC